jgi:DNA modification methylase
MNRVVIVVDSAFIPEAKCELAAPVFRDDLVTAYQADCLDLLPTMPAGSVAAVITDPPYGLEFMGRAWDKPWSTGDGFRRSRNPKDTGRDNVFGRLSERGPEYAAGSGYQSWCLEWASECLRVLKPGGHLLALGSPRTWHRLAAALEDAGFEIRDTIAWLHGQGFPKSLDVARAVRLKTTTPWQGWGTGLKPAFEPIIVARKPLIGTVGANVLKHGTGGLHIDACRVPISDADRVTINRKHAGMSAETYQRAPGSSLNLSVKPLPLKPAHAHERGRWPANVVLVHDPACGDRCAPGCPVAELDQQSGRSVSRASPPRRGAAGLGWGMTATGSEYNDVGGASRFFPAFRWQAKAPSRERPKIADRGHPTVKPVALMRWLVRLVAPPGGLILDPFLGSGTTAEAARAEGFRCIGIEREAVYIPLIRARLRKRSEGSAGPGRATEQPSGGSDPLHAAERDLAQTVGYRGPP